MAALYVTSLETGAGKTAVCAGIGRHLLADGKKIGFFKPIIGEKGVDSDAAFLKHIFTLKEPVKSLCPVISDEDKVIGQVKEAYARVSSGKDVVMVEGGGELSIIEALGARAIIVEGYSGELSRAKINSYKDFGEYLLGVVLNKVPRSQAERVHGEMSTQFGEAGINILGVLPEDRALVTLTVGELAEHIQGEILNSAEKSAELVENFMLGAMVVDPGPEYFGRKANKVVVVRGDRPDMQMAALETSTVCLVLSGNTSPIPDVLNRAEAKKIPIILAKDDTAALVTSIEDALGKTRFHQEEKLPKLTEIIEQHFNFKALYKGLGLSPSP
ncbi:MAG: DRTGG domain-containing protein [Dehalococcoidales bacterium]